MHRALPSRILLLVLWSASAIPAQDSEDPELLYQKAVHWEVVEGDLERALELYRKVTLLSSVSRSTAARALLRMGQCLEKLGRADASRIYRRILDEYGDQPGIAHQARLSLERLGTEQRFSKSSGSTLRFVLADERLSWWPLAADFDFSPDGKRLVFRASLAGDFQEGVSFSDDLGYSELSVHLGLFVTDRTGSLVRPLVRDWGPWRFPASPRWSPDGQMICYLAATNVVRESGRPEEVRGIFVVPAKGGEQRRIGPYLSAATSQVFWSPEGLLTYVNPQGLHTVDLEGRLLTKVTFEGELARFGGYSSDGRWVVFQARAAQDDLRPNMDIWIMPSNGGPAGRITRSPTLDVFPAWDTRKNSIYFVSSRNGDPNIWEVSVDLRTGTRLGEPRQVTAYRGTTIVRPQVIAQKNEIAFGLVRQTSVINVASTDLSGEPKTVTKGSWPLLSPDGQTVYFVGEEGQPGIFVVSRAGGEPRQLTDSLLPNAYGPGFDLSSDGQTLVFLAPTPEGKAISRLSLSGGSPELLVELENRSGVHPQPRWSPNGDLVAYAFNGSLNVIPAGGGQPKKLAKLNWYNPTIRWSPDGEYLAGLGYLGSIAGSQSFGVFVVRLSDGQVRRLTTVEEHHWKEGLEWHPNGQELTFMDYRKDGIRKAYLDGRPTSPWLDLEEHWDHVG